MIEVIELTIAGVLAFCFLGILIGVASLEGGSVMSRISECDGCRMGDHKRHRRVIQAVPPGMMGGVVCGCRGECVKRGPRHDPQVDMIMRMVRDAGFSEAPDG
jgi:hypothetical protein